MTTCLVIYCQYINRKKPFLINFWLGLLNTIRGKCL